MFDEVARGVPQLTALLGRDPRRFGHRVGVFGKRDVLDFLVACLVQLGGHLRAHTTNLFECLALVVLRRHRFGRARRRSCQDLLGGRDDNVGFLGVDPRNLGQLLDIGVSDVLELVVPEGKQRVDHVFVDTLELEQVLARLFHHVLEARLTDDVQVPAGQLGCQAHVLATASNRQAELVVRNDQLHGHIVLVDEHLGDLGRADGVGDEARRVFDVRHDVNLLTVEFLHNRLHTRTAHADTRADRIDVTVTAVDRHFGAHARLASHGDDTHDILVNLRNFVLEQVDEQLWIGASEHHLGAAARALDLFDHRLNAVARAIALARGLLTPRQKRVGAAQVDDDIALLESTHDAGDHVTDAVLVLVVDDIALGLAHPLDDHLLGGLRRDAPERRVVGVELEQLAEALVLGLGLFLVLFTVEDLKEELVARLGAKPGRFDFIDRDLPIGIFHVVIDRDDLEQLDLAAVLVKLRLDLTLGPVGTPGRRQDRCFERLDERLAVDPFVPSDLVYDGVQIHGRTPKNRNRISTGPL